MSKIQEKTILEKLRVLCSNPKFLSTYAKIVLNDRYISYNFLTNPIENLIPSKSFTKLNEAELLLLLNFIVEGKNSDGTLSIEDVSEEYEEDTRQLLETLHEEIGEGMLSSLLDILNDPRGRQLSEFPDLNSDGIREISLYTEEFVYDFQLLELAAERYESDDAWLKKNLGFTSLQMVRVVKLISRLQFCLLAGSVDGTVAGSFDAFDITDIVNRLVTEEGAVVSRVIIFFTTEVVQFPISVFGDYNELIARPIVKIHNRLFLFLQSTLARACYEAPFYSMIQDKEYAPIVANHRGDFTENFVFTSLLRTFGPNQVFRNVNLWRGKNKVGEIDILAVSAGQAVIIQCKSKGMTQSARSGDLHKAQSDFQLAVKNAFEQNILCGKYLVDTDVEFKDSTNRTVNISHSYAKIYPITVVSDIYPSLAIQAEQFISSEDIQQSRLSGIELPIFTDIFFIDVLTEILKYPLLFLDFLGERSKAGRNIHAQTELNILGAYLSYPSFSDIDSLEYIGEDVGLNVDAIMIARRSLPVMPKNVDLGFLTLFEENIEQKNVGRILNKITIPESYNDFISDSIFLHVAADSQEELESAIETLVKKCSLDSPVHTLSFQKNSRFGISLVACNRRSNQYEYPTDIINYLNNQCKNRQGSWSILIFDSSTLKIIGSEIAKSNDKW